MGRPCLHCERQPPPPGPLPHKEGGGDTTWRYAKYFAWAAALSRVCLQLVYVAAGDSQPSVDTTVQSPQQFVLAGSGQSSDEKANLFVRMWDTMRRFLALIGFVLGLALPAAGQDAAAVLLPRINSLRASKGLPGYGLHASLTAAANSHARWMADTGEIAHYQHDGSGPRTRAVNAGFPSDWISENIYRGASPLTAWEWWLNSPIHYAGIVSPNYDKIGIGSASGAHGNAYVLVFGNSTGRLLGGRARTESSAGGSAPAGSPSYVLGLDEFGNIKHEVQPGQTIGHILLIYGYTWDEYPYLLEINGMSEADRLNMQPGSVILVPPQDGTYTPAPATARARASATAAPTVAPTAAPAPLTPTPAAQAAPTVSLRIHIASPASPEARRADDERDPASSMRELTLLSLAIMVQLGILGVASVALISRSR